MQLRRVLQEQRRPCMQSEMSDLLRVFTVFNRSSPVLRKGGSVLAAAQGFFRRLWAILDSFGLCLVWWPPNRAVTELWAVAAMKVSQWSLHLTRRGRAEGNLSPPSGTSPVAEREEPHDHVQPKSRRGSLLTAC